MKQRPTVERRPKARTAARKHPAGRVHAARDHAAVCSLAADCTIGEAAALKERLGKLFDLPVPVTLDATVVTRVDTASLQILAAFVRDRRALGRPVVWRAVTDTLAQSARLLGLARLLELTGGERGRD